MAPEPIQCICCKAKKDSRQEPPLRFHSLTNITGDLLAKVNRRIAYINQHNGHTFPAIEAIDPSMKACHKCFKVMSEYGDPPQPSGSHLQVYDDTPDLSFFRKATQLNNAPSYYALHTFRNHGTFAVSRMNPNSRRPIRINWAQYNIDVAQPVLYRAKMASRYRGGIERNIFILVDAAKSGREAIIEYYCSCDSGARTIGCCSHVMAVVYYLSHGRIHGVSPPNPDLPNLTIQIPRPGEEAQDSDDD